MKSRENSESETTMVADSILEEPSNSEKWAEEAKKQLKLAKSSPAVKSGSITESEAAKLLLARKMQQQITSEAMQSTNGVYQDLVSASLNRVDFDELAEEVLRSMQDE